MSVRKLISSAGLAAIIVLPILAWQNAQAIEDWWRLRDYTPSQEVVALATDTKMTDFARRVFYVNHPSLVDDVKSFRESCPQSEQTIVLGCYLSGQNGITVYEVKDERLANAPEVTAAHEMLHAAYDRLSDDERSRVNSLLNDYYKNSLNNERILDTIDLYKQIEPNDVVNEMHSIFGTEILSLPTELEDYYKRYFTDRSLVAMLAASYEKEFESRQTQIKDYENQLDDLRARILADERSLRNQLSDLEAERNRLDYLKDSGQTEEYNAAVPGFNSMVRSYNSGARDYNANVKAYNDLLAAYRRVAGELQNLYNAIDTRLTTQPAN